MAYPQAAKVVADFFHVEDGLDGTDSEQEAIELQKQLQTAFSRFPPTKWNSNELNVLKHLHSDLIVDQIKRYLIVRNIQKHWVLNEIPVQIISSRAIQIQHQPLVTASPSVHWYLILQNE